ncbi:hypothetical protein KDH_21790 [Dictyobacter sp. S3.2.2.5]|uniref:4Fe-4S Wbl-type domain-containing protein n=1 Tax=Dictyobacter halimunensis TaxID=3026934 RepID=A0ABQ6FNS8_9CHLR|nr:hypothetical protein KDH_21790 [Dictyobacter sp. S3.2.2.5]
MTRGRNGRDNEGMKKQHYTDTSNCEYCSNGLTCPYWWQDPDDGVWYHNPSGSRRYIQDALIEGQFGEIPHTPDGKDDKGKGKGGDDDGPTQYPRRKRGLR